MPKKKATTKRVVRRGRPARVIVTPEEKQAKEREAILKSVAALEKKLLKLPECTAAMFAQARLVECLTHITNCYK